MSSKNKYILLGITAGVSAAAGFWYLTKKPVIKATCIVGPNGKPCAGGSEAPGIVSGKVTLADYGSKTKISYKVTGLTPGQHGFHIHEKADFSNGCISAGPHYNPYGQKHGSPDDDEFNRHVGDLGNITANESGIAEGELEDKLIKLSGEFSVIGRSFMVHAGVDDLGKGGHELSSTTGNAGGRVACGEIKLD